MVTDKPVVYHVASFLKNEQFSKLHDKIVPSRKHNLTEDHHMMAQDVDSAYASKLVEAAQGLFDFADQYRGLYHDSITDAGSYYRCVGVGAGVFML